MCINVSIYLYMYAFRERGRERDSERYIYIPGTPMTTLLDGSLSIFWSKPSQSTGHLFPTWGVLEDGASPVVTMVVSILPRDDLDESGTLFGNLHMTKNR